MRIMECLCACDWCIFGWFVNSLSLYTLCEPKLQYKVLNLQRFCQPTLCTLSCGWSIIAVHKTMLKSECILTKSTQTLRRQIKTYTRDRALCICEAANDVNKDRAFPTRTTTYNTIVFAHMCNTSIISTLVQKHSLLYRNTCLASGQNKHINHCTSHAFCAVALNASLQRCIEHCFT